MILAKKNVTPEQIVSEFCNSPELIKHLANKIKERVKKNEICIDSEKMFDTFSGLFYESLSKLADELKLDGSYVDVLFDKDDELEYRVYSKVFKALGS